MVCTVRKPMKSALVVSSESLSRRFSSPQLPLRRPAGVAGRPHRPGIEPDGEGLRKIFVGMALRVPVIEMVDEAFAVRLRRVVLGVRGGRRAEQTPPRRTAPEQVRVVDGVA